MGGTMRLLKFLWIRRTTAFGYFQVILGVLAASDGVFAPKVLKWMILGNGCVTACIGHYNNSQLNK